jgi:Flp pilus assembly secretin CpaC
MGIRLAILRSRFHVMRPVFEIALGCCLLSGALAAAKAEEVLTVTVDQARIVKVPVGTKTLVIGNPMIADVTLLKNGATMVITGKGFGETNFIALDGDGAPVAQSEIRVISGTNALIVQRGMDRQSYTCAPRCQPTARLGDDAGYFNDVAGQISAHNAGATK